MNGKDHKVEVLPDTPLLWILRDNLGLTATKYGCGVSDCGACTVLVDGKSRKSCRVPVHEIENRKITTLEGLAKGKLHPVQQAWIDEDVPQCGYCQSGQIMAAVSLLSNTPDPSDEEIDRVMSGNICRCGTYDRIRKAIKRAAKAGAGQ